MFVRMRSNAMPEMAAAGTAAASACAYESAALFLDTSTLVSVFLLAALLRRIWALAVVHAIE